MKLSYMQPISEGDTLLVSPDVSILKQGARDWALTLVGHFLDNRLPFSMVKSITMKMWVSEGLVDVLPQGNGIFFFRLSKDSGCKIILEGGPRLIAGRHLFLRRWEAGLNLSVEAVDRIPVWI